MLQDDSVARPQTGRLRWHRRCGLSPRGPGGLPGSTEPGATGWSAVPLGMMVMKPFFIVLPSEVILHMSLSSDVIDTVMDMYYVLCSIVYYITCVYLFI